MEIIEKIVWIYQINGNEWINEWMDRNELQNGWK
jgi:hypothetical protein